MNVLERYSSYICGLNRNMNCLSCKATGDDLYLPNSDEFYVRVEESKSGDTKGVYLHSNKVKKYIGCIARLQEKLIHIIIGHIQVLIC